MSKNGPKSKGKAPKSGFSAIAAPIKSAFWAGLASLAKEVLVVAGSVAYEILVCLPINPGVAAAWPSESQRARGYQHYNLERLVLRWTPSLSADVASGNICILPVWGDDQNERLPATFQEAAARKGAMVVNAGVAKSMNVTRSIVRSKPFYPVRAGPTGRPVPETDVGAIYIIAEGQASPASCGLLHLDATFRYAEIAPVTTGAVVPSLPLYYGSQSSTVLTTTVETTALPVMEWDSMALVYDTGEITVPPGLFEVTYNAYAYTSGAWTNCIGKLYKDNVNVGSQYAIVGGSYAYNHHVDVMQFDAAGVIKYTNTATASGTITLLKGQLRIKCVGRA
jgi:hypothetical protein